MTTEKKHWRITSFLNGVYAKWRGLLMAAVLFVFVLNLWLAWPIFTSRLLTPALVREFARNTAPAPAGSASAPTSAAAIGFAELGQTGDAYGGLNALFAGLAFFGVAVAATYQRKAFETQREQLDLEKRGRIDAQIQLKDAQVAEATARAADVARQAVERHQQKVAAFEPLFFRLLDLFRDQRYKARISYPRLLVEVPFSSPAVGAFLRTVAATFFRAGTYESGAQLEYIAIRYVDIYRMNENQVGSMFRTLYHAFQLIYRSGLDEVEQVRYANIARGLLGSDDLLWLMMNCLSPVGAQTKPYIELYGLLKHVKVPSAHDGRPNDDDLIDGKLAALFARTAVMGYAERKAYWATHPRPQMVG